MFPFSKQLSSRESRNFGFRTNSLIAVPRYVGVTRTQDWRNSRSTVESTHPPKCNRWKRSQRPRGKDHSLGFPRAQRASDNESTSTQSEVILFQSPIMNFERPVPSGQSSNTVLPPITESRDTEQPGPQGSQTPVFGTSTNEDDPWLTSDNPIQSEVNENTPRRVQRNQQVPFDYGALIWKCLREGDDPWNED